MDSLSNYLPPLLITFGAIAVVVSILEFIVFVMAISLCCAQRRKRLGEGDKY
jgi:hypothetical protein